MVTRTDLSNFKVFTQTDYVERGWVKRKCLAPCKAFTHLARLIYRVAVAIFSRMIGLVFQKPRKWAKRAFRLAAADARAFLIEVVRIFSDPHACHLVSKWERSRELLSTGDGGSGSSNLLLTKKEALMEGAGRGEIGLPAALAVLICEYAGASHYLFGAQGGVGSIAGYMRGIPPYKHFDERYITPNFCPGPRIVCSPDKPWIFFVDDTGQDKAIVAWDYLSGRKIGSWPLAQGKRPRAERLVSGMEPLDDGKLLISLFIAQSTRASDHLDERVAIWDPTGQGKKATHWFRRYSRSLRGEGCVYQSLGKGRILANNGYDISDPCIIDEKGKTLHGLKVPCGVHFHVLEKGLVAWRKVRSNVTFFDRQGKTKARWHLEGGWQDVIVGHVRAAIVSPRDGTIIVFDARSGQEQYRNEGPDLDGAKFLPNDDFMVLREGVCRILDRQGAVKATLLFDYLFNSMRLFHCLNSGKILFQHWSTEGVMLWNPDDNTSTLVSDIINLERCSMINLGGDDFLVYEEDLAPHIWRADQNRLDELSFHIDEKGPISCIEQLEGRRVMVIYEESWEVWDV